MPPNYYWRDVKYFFITHPPLASGATNAPDFDAVLDPNMDHDQPNSVDVAGRVHACGSTNDRSERD